MSKHHLLLVLTLVLCLALCIPVEAQSKEDTEEEIRKLKMQLWYFKKLVLNPELRKEVPALQREHRVVPGIGFKAASGDVASLLKLKSGEGLVITAVTDKAKQAGFREGDVLLRFQTPFDDWLPATSKNFKMIYLPEDVLKTELYRDMKKHTVSMKLACCCGMRKCPLASPLGSKSGLRKTRIRLNETHVIGVLKTIVAGQEQFRSGVCVDQDSNGIGEYGFLGELAGTRNYRGSSASSKNAPFIPSTLGKIDGKGRARSSGYYYIVYLPGHEKAVTELDEVSSGDPCNQEEQYVVYAFPVEPGKSGNRVFVMTSHAQILCLPNLDGEWGGDKIPPPGLAFKKGKDPSFPSAELVRPGEKGAAKEAWVHYLNYRPKKPKRPEGKKATAIVESWKRIWREAIDEYYDGLESGKDPSSMMDIAKLLDRSAKKLGFQDWTDACVQASNADPDAYKDYVEKMVKYTTERAKEYAKSRSK